MENNFVNRKKLSKRNWNLSWLLEMNIYIYRVVGQHALIFHFENACMKIAQRDIPLKRIVLQKNSKVKCTMSHPDY